MRQSTLSIDSAHLLCVLSFRPSKMILGARGLYVFHWGILHLVLEACPQVRCWFCAHTRGSVHGGLQRLCEGPQHQLAVSRYALNGRFSGPASFDHRENNPTLNQFIVVCLSYCACCCPQRLTQDPSHGLPLCLAPRATAGSASALHVVRWAAGKLLPRVRTAHLVPVAAAPDAAQPASTPLHLSNCRRSASGYQHLPEQQQRQHRKTAQFLKRRETGAGGRAEGNQRFLPPACEGSHHRSRSPLGLLRRRQRRLQVLQQRQRHQRLLRIPARVSAAAVEGVEVAPSAEAGQQRQEGAAAAGCCMGWPRKLAQAAAAPTTLLDVRLPGAGSAAAALPRGRGRGRRKLSLEQLLLAPLLVPMPTVAVQERSQQRKQPHAITTPRPPTAMGMVATVLDVEAPAPAEGGMGGRWERRMGLGVARNKKIQEQGQQRSKIRGLPA